MDGHILKKIRIFFLPDDGKRIIQKINTYIPEYYTYIYFLSFIPLLRLVHHLNLLLVLHQDHHHHHHYLDVVLLLLVG